MTVSNLSLFKRPNGFWYILFTVDGRRKWKSTKCTERSDALKKLTEFNELTKPKPQANRLSSFTKEFLQFSSSTYAKASVDLFRVSSRNLLAISGDCMLTEISPRHIDHYKAERLKMRSPVTVNVELRTLRTILNYAVRWKLIETNPFARVQLVRIPEMPPLYFTKEEFRLLLTVVDQVWFKEIIIFTVMTGMRRGEVANLHWSDIDFDRRIVHIHSTSTFKSKWGKQRVIPLNDQVFEMLKSKRSEDPGGFVFMFQGKKVKEGYLSQRFKDYVRSARITEKLHFHSLRHTFATWLVQDSVSIYEIQKLLGHSSIEMTQIYSHLQSEQLHATVNRIRVPTEST